uniref:ALA-interacting subunit 3-like n=1 Tax=Hirondellea gigas TaxID=1518452 RepID=A0A6A7G478_9CRUS
MQEIQEEKNNRRPRDTAFKQQRLPAWQPILTPRWVVATFFVLGVIFLPIGASLLVASNKVVELTVRYDNNPDCKLGLDDPKYGTECAVTLKITEDIELPVFVYYQLDNFYQNHRRYVKSRSDAQLRGEDPDSLSACEPLEKEGGKTLYPCGLIAHSFFSDLIIAGITPNGQSTEISLVNPDFNFTYADNILSWKKQGISWKSDRDAKFKLSESISNEADTFTTPFLDKFTRIGPEQARINKFLGLNNGSVDESLKIKIPLPTDEDFIVWMRTAGLPTFKKLYRKIEALPSAVDRSKLISGDEITFHIKNYFRVEEFDGKKSIVLSTTSWVGGKNSFLGIAYLVVGSICLFLSVAFLIKHTVSPRKLGDMRYFNWNSNEQRSRQAQ